MPRRFVALALVLGCADNSADVTPSDSGSTSDGADGSSGEELDAKYHHCAIGHEVHAVLEDPGELTRIVVDAGDPSDPEDDVFDLRMPDGVIAWLEANDWHQQHDDWHNVRRWDQGCGISNATVEGPDGQLGTADDCGSAQQLLDKGLWRAPIQEGAPGDGYDFLLMHRHMIDTIRAAFPDHPEHFSSFERVPRSTDDPNNPMPWLNVSWTADQLEAIETLENIEANLDRFPTEDALGLYIEAPFRWTTERPNVNTADRSNGIHFMLHAQWAVPGSPINLANGPDTISNRVFWHLHGWIDDVWERYRVAKGLTRDDPDYQAALFAQCKEMVDLGEALDGNGGNDPAEGGTGVFATEIQPLFDAYCVGCHGPTGAQLGLVLGPASTFGADEIAANLIGVPSTEVDLALIEPGDPAASWLFAKITGHFDGIDCGSVCTTMPPAGSMIPDDGIAIIEQWITEGAEVQ